MSFPDRDEDGFGPDQAAAGVSPAGLSRIRVFLRVLDAWRTRLNLIGPGEGRHLWRRHVFDSLQALDLIGAGEGTLVDLGSGAGFPGIILACALADEDRIAITLVEKSPRKAAFLEAAVRAVFGEQGPVIRNQRIEDAPPERFDIVTARALAPLPKLLGYVDAWAKPTGRAVLWKGREANSELTLSRESWSFEFAIRASRSNPEGQVLTISSVGRRT